MSADEPAVRLCCLLWAAEGEGGGLHAYEDVVLGLVPAHDGEVLVREFGDGADGAPHEVQVIAFRGRAALDGRKSLEEARAEFLAAAEEAKLKLH